MSAFSAYPREGLQNALWPLGGAPSHDHQRYLAAFRNYQRNRQPRNAHNDERIKAERAHLKQLPQRRTTDFEKTVPSRLIGHRLRVRLIDDRLDVFVGGTHLMTLQGGRGHAEAGTIR